MEIPNPSDCSYFFICRYVGYSTCPTECSLFLPVDKTDKYITEDKDFPWQDKE
jgi:hypothetical protein